MPALQKEKRTAEHQQPESRYTQKAVITDTDTEESTRIKEGGEAAHKYIHIQTLQTGDIFVSMYLALRRP